MSDYQQTWKILFDWPKDFECKFNKIQISKITIEDLIISFEIRDTSRGSGDLFVTFMLHRRQFKFSCKYFPIDMS